MGVGHQNRWTMGAVAGALFSSLQGVSDKENLDNLKKEEGESRLK